jgi:hypothetical protein
VAGDSHARRTRRALRELERAREAVAQAVAERQDPWRVAELRQRERELADRATAQEDDLDRGGLRARTRGTPWPVR